MARMDPMMAPLPRGYGQHDEDHGKDHDGQTASMQSSTEPSVSPQTLSLLDSLDEALGSLESEDVHDRAVAATQLSKLVEGVYGEDAAVVGNYVRESGALEMLLELVLAPLYVPQRHERTAQHHCTARMPMGLLSDATVLWDAQVADPAPDVHQKMLMVLGNLVSDAVDPQVSSPM